jgi:hypothetical protein
MRIKPFKVGSAIALIGGLMAQALPAAAAVDPFDGNWHFGVTPYLWLPNVNVNLDHDFQRLQTNRLQTEIGPNSYLENLELGLLVTGEVRQGPWSAFTDLISAVSPTTLTSPTRTCDSPDRPLGSALCGKGAVAPSRWRTEHRIAQSIHPKPHRSTTQ